MFYSNIYYAGTINRQAYTPPKLHFEWRVGSAMKKSIITSIISNCRAYQHILCIPCLSFFKQWELCLICAENYEKLHAFRMKHGFLSILGIFSPGLYLIITHSRNKLICYCGFGTVLLFAENHIFLDSEKPSNQQKESPQTFTIQ